MKKLAIVLAMILLLSSCSQEKVKQTEELSTENMTEDTTEKVAEKQTETTSISEDTTKQKAEKISKPAKKVDNTQTFTYEEAYNKDQYTGFSSEQIARLNEQGFLVLEDGGTGSGNYHSYYEFAQYAYEPVYITTDAVLNAFDIFYSGSMTELEVSNYYFEQNKIVLGLLEEVLAAAKDSKDEEMIVPYKKAIAYLYTAARLFHEKDDVYLSGYEDYAPRDYELVDEYRQLEFDFAKLTKQVPEGAKKLSDEEYEKVIAAAGLSESELFSYKVDYSQFKPRGHYTLGPILENYFLGMMWLSNPGFELEGSDDDLRTALILASAFYSNDELLSAWKDGYEMSTYYSAASDDLNVLDFDYIIGDILLFDKKRYKDIGDYEVLDMVKEEVKKLRAPKIVAVLAENSENTISTKKQFRYMGQRYNADQFILEKLSKPILKPDVSAFEFFGIMGNERAREIADNMYRPAKRWDGYEERYAFVKEIYNLKKDIIFTDDLYHDYLKVIDLCLNSEVDVTNPNVPKFMKTDAYDYMRINSALGALAQLKHANVLYSKQMFAEMGGPEDKMVPHYIEPNPELYRELAKMMRGVCDRLKIMGVDPYAKNEYGYYEDFVPAREFAENMEAFAEISEKELAGEELSDDELRELAYFGGFCDAMHRRFKAGALEWDYGFKLGGKDLSQPVISDIATVDGTYLELGIGIPMDVYVLVSQNGKKVLARGVLYSSYEFYSPTRLSDEEWRNMLYLPQVSDGVPAPSRMNKEMSLLKFMPYADEFVFDGDNEIKEANVELEW